MAMRGSVELVHGGGRPTWLAVYDDGLLLVDGRRPRFALGLSNWAFRQVRGAAGSAATVRAIENLGDSATASKVAATVPATTFVPTENVQTVEITRAALGQYSLRVVSIANVYDMRFSTVAAPVAAVEALLRPQFSDHLRIGPAT